VRASAAAALAVLSLAASGCGSGVGVAVSGDTDKSHGKELFLHGEKGKAACAACHTLAEAKATGKVGPNLDLAFRPSSRQGFKESTIRQVVADQIRFPGDYGDKGPTMPKNLVEGSDVDDVAAYVAAVAGPRKGVSISASGAPPTTTQASPPPSGDGNLAAGKKAFADNQCAGCHTLAAAGATGKVGPDLDKLKTYAADAKKPLNDFIRESIVKPNAYIEKGYSKGIMPPTFASLPKSTLDALVAFLAASAK
jgi:mono/diheme cytochrome c family protein